MQKTRIAWTDETWNPVHGCSRVSTGCDNCYAETLSLRMKLTTKAWTGENASENVTIKPHKLKEPYALKQPSRVFVNSMSDIFHPIGFPDAFITDVFQVMNDLTSTHFSNPNQASKARRESGKRQWGENIWQGTSAENQENTCIGLTRFVNAMRKSNSFHLNRF